MQLRLGAARRPPVRDLEVEVVERKGLGHPDSLCDALADELSRALSAFYLEHAGAILHHNVDKALLFGGAARPEFGGGSVLAPMRLYLVGRATLDVSGIAVPIDTLATETTRKWLRANLEALDPERHIEVLPLIRPGSADLVELFLRQQRLAVPLANDTSVGVGFAPLTDLESVVSTVEAALSARGEPDELPELGEDIKVMGVRHGERIALTLACAFLGRRLPDMRAYLQARERVRLAGLAAARTVTTREVSVEINMADDPGRGSVYITVTGTSAEAGDDGQAGRGNRANGLITPYRPMTLESAAGKNPVSHVGKLYQIAAQRIAEALTSEISAIRAAECVLVSRIGHPIDDPQMADVRVELTNDSRPETYALEVERIVSRVLGELPQFWREFVRIVPGRVG
jgi:S-adenosylmethionine synthetase